MMRKKSFVIFALCGAILLGACGRTTETTPEQTEEATTVTTEESTAEITTVSEIEVETTPESSAHVARLEPLYAAAAFRPTDDDEIQQRLAFGYTRAEAEIVDGIVGLGWRAWQKLAASSPDENVVFSTPSLALALGMLAEGAQGVTREELVVALGIPEDGKWMEALIAALNLSLEDDGQPELIVESSRALWLQDGYRLRADYGETASQAWHADINVWARDEREAAHEAIGEWYEEKSHGLLPATTVPETLPNESMSLVLLDALYFKGQWWKAFEPAMTMDDVFFTEDGETLPVRMMQQRLLAQTALVQEDYQIAGLLLGGGYEFVVALPTGERGAGELLEDADFRRDFAALGEDEAGAAVFDIEWQLPQLDLKLGADLLPLLRELGATAAMGAEADFGGLFEDAAPGDFVLSALRQDARLLLDEDGVEAAAVTMAAVEATAMPIQGETLVMRLDRPFIAEIRSQNGLPLFSMVVHDPGVRP
ncbi:MAG: serpin family protein [Bacillota bacterium]|nr:serpin family protein [Bacillota bacterium]